MALVSLSYLRLQLKYQHMLTLLANDTGVQRSPDINYFDLNIAGQVIDINIHNPTHLGIDLLHRSKFQ